MQRKVLDFLLTSCLIERRHELDLKSELSFLNLVFWYQSSCVAELERWISIDKKETIDVCYSGRGPLARLVPSLQ